VIGERAHNAAAQIRSRRTAGQPAVDGGLTELNAVEGLEHGKEDAP